jgi:hypothetical protein
MEKFLLSLCWRGVEELCRYGYHQKYHRTRVLARKSERRPIGELGILQSAEFDHNDLSIQRKGYGRLQIERPFARSPACKLSAIAAVRAAATVRQLIRALPPFALS